MSSFNPEQARAIKASSTEDILISAGAGSGKTKTLSERVFRLIDSGEIKPSELLVLTFTNNAAYEMKQRIIARFKENGSPLSEQMPSSHVQTFDSFSSYLVTTYAGRLGLSNTFSLINDTVRNAKLNTLLDEILSEYYLDEEKRKRLLDTLKKTDTKQDAELKKIILSLYWSLDRILPQKRIEFVRDYKEKFLSKEFHDACIQEMVGNIKTIIQTEISKSFFVETFYEDFFAQDASFDEKNIKQVFSNTTFFEKDIAGLQFEEKNLCQGLYENLMDLLDKDGEEFLRALSCFQENNSQFFPSRLSQKLVSDKSLVKKAGAVRRPMYLLFATGDAKLANYVVYSKPEEDFELWKSFAPDVALLFEIAEELRARLLDYKRSINAFDFSDISLFALRLVTEPEFGDIANDIRRRFKYIMVDEYQDTNDFQEAFIDSLLTPVDGQRAHLFCVGDAKQSIYGFRNSNVALFRQRQAAYEEGEGHEVIHMNKNYRSGKRLLEDINYIFRRFMRLDQGSICYEDPGEQLQYDEAVNLYHEPFLDFGIHRIVPVRPVEGGAEAKKQWEAIAIARSILKMIEEKAPVYDAKKQIIRPCQYSDFAVLSVKKKGAFALYQKLFKEFNIPLNLSVSTNLREIDALLLIQSLMSLIAWKMGGEEVDIPHLFASVARSYVYQYDDETIYQRLLSATPNRDEPRMLSSWIDDPVMKEIDDFCAAHETSSFSTIFLDMLKDFRTQRDLYKLGEVQDTVAKIETIYQMVLAEESSGEGLFEFVEVFKKIRKYNLDLADESDFEGTNCVDLMTVHASKGLERKIVFMPSSFNVKMEGNKMQQPHYLFSQTYGVLLPNYIHGDQEKKQVFTIPYALANAKKKEEDPTYDEHVRLLYVALTRAENSIYLVGERPMKAEGSLYQMLDHVPHFSEYCPGLLQKAVEEGILEQDKVDSFQRLSLALQDARPPLGPESFSPEGYLVYKAVFDHLTGVKKAELKKIQEGIDGALKGADEVVQDWGFDFLTQLTYHSDEYEDRRILLPQELPFPLGESDPVVHPLDPSQINDAPIDFPLREKKRASGHTPVDCDTPVEKILSRGVYLHRLIELVPWPSKDVSYISDPRDKERIERVLALPLFSDLEKKTLYPEYGYYDEDLKTTGFIDLLLVDGEEFTIIDFKSSSLEDPEYVGQLHAYQRNVMRLFHAKPDHIRLVLVSINNADTKEIPVEK